MPFAILVVESLFEHKENALRHRCAVAFVWCKKRKLSSFKLVILESTTQLPLLCMFAVFPNRSTS